MNTKNPLFSVVIPTYHISKGILPTLESLNRQTFRDFEVIIVDDGSKDDTKDVILGYTSSFPLTFLQSHNWGGPARPRNIGIQAAKGEWISFLDHDDLWFENKLEIVASHVYSGAQVISHGLERCFLSPLSPKRSHKGKPFLGRVLDSSDPFMDLLCRGCSMGLSSVSVKKSALTAVMGFDENPELISVEDFDLWIRLAAQKCTFHHIPQILGSLQISEESLSHLSYKQIQVHQTLYKKHLIHIPKEKTIPVEAFLAYTQGRLLHKLGQPVESRPFYWKAFLGVTSFDYKLKSLLGLGLSFLSKRGHVR